MAVIVVTRRNIFAIKMGSKVGAISGSSGNGVRVWATRRC